MKNTQKFMLIISKSLSAIIWPPRQTFSMLREILKSSKSDLKKDIEIVKSDLKKDMAELGERLTIRLVIVGGIQVGIISLIMGMFKFLMPIGP